MPDRILYGNRASDVTLDLDSSGSLNLATYKLTLTGNATLPGLDHGGLAGLADDDHPQYLLETQYAEIYRQGFLNLTETSIGFDGTNTFTLTSVGASWSYYRAGVKYTISGNKTVVIPGTPIATGHWHIYIDATDGTLTASQTDWTLLDAKVPVASIQFNDALTPKYWLADERHTILIDQRMQYFLHTITGSKLSSAPTLTGYTLSTDTDVAKTFAISACTLIDQDLKIDLAALTDPDGTATDYVVWYRTSSTAWAWAASAMPFPYSATYIQYDSAGTLTTGQTTKYYNSYLLVTNLQGASRFIVIPGRAEFSSLATAQAEDVASFTWGTFDVDEAVICYRLTWQTSAAHSSKGKCVLAAAPQPINISTVTNVSSGAGTDHNTLSNLQGGTSNEYYHLTSAQHTTLTTNPINGAGTATRLAQWSDADTLAASTLIKDGTGVLTLNTNNTNDSSIMGKSGTGDLSLSANYDVSMNILSSQRGVGVGPGLSFDDGFYTFEVSSQDAANVRLYVNGNGSLDFSGDYTLTIAGAASVSGTNTGDQSAANPTATIGLTAVNGSAVTFMRSDGAPALGVGITPTWTGVHTFGNTTDSTSATTGSIVASGGIGTAKQVTVGTLLGVGRAPTVSGAVIDAAISNAGAASVLAFTNTAAAGTGNQAGIQLRANTDVAERATLAMYANFTTVTDASRASSVIFQTQSGGAIATSLTIDASRNLVVAGGVTVSGTTTGVASSTSFTNVTNTTVTNTYLVRGGQAANTVNTGWIKVFIGTTAAWIPYWANATP